MRPVRALLLILLRGYQRLVSPLLPPVCRFEPSCSEYARQAIERHGSARGLWLACCRLLRCQPWSRGGFDPVPDGRRRHGRLPLPDSHPER